MKETYVCIDASNLLYRIFYAKMYTSKSSEFDDDPEQTKKLGIELAFHGAFTSLQKYYYEYRPTKIFMCFDGRSWRKDYTNSPQCVSQKKYKANRRQNMTPSQEELYKIFLEYLEDFYNLLRQHTSIITLRSENLEADDLISGLCQTFDDKQLYVISSDKDFIQLLRYPNVTVFDPLSGTKRDLTEWNDDVNYYLFMKCVKGDPGDNVQSAYPGVRKTRIKKAYDDDYQLVQMMNETWTHPDGRTMRVADLFEENVLLMDLCAQPDNIKAEIMSCIESSVVNVGKASHFHLLKFFGQHRLEFLAKNIDRFMAMLSL